MDSDMAATDTALGIIVGTADDISTKRVIQPVQQR